MSGKFISLVIAASIAVTGLTAAPARASDRDVARALAAIAGIAIVGAVIHDANKDKRRAVTRSHNNRGFTAQRPYRPAKPLVHPRRNAIAERAYRQGYADHRRVVRERRIERRSERRADRWADRRADRWSDRRAYDGQRGYSARPYGYAN